MASIAFKFRNTLKVSTFHSYSYSTLILGQNKMQEKDTKVIEIRKEKKLCFLIDNTIVHLKTQKIHLENLHLINK